jgi:hypothetical protein
MTVVWLEAEFIKTFMQRDMFGTVLLFLPILLCPTCYCHLFVNTQVYSYITQS